MTILTFKTGVEDINPTIDITNWRAIKRYDMFVGNWMIGQDHYPGSLMVLQDLTYIVSLPFREILAFDSLPPRTIKEALFSHAPGAAPGYCGCCKGSGKLDWVDKAMARGDYRKELVRSMRDFERKRKTFKRDKNHFLLYRDKDSKISGRTLLSLTTIDERIECYCPECSGTGLMLDGRRRIFESMPRIRKSLFRVERKFYEDMASSVR